MGKTYKDTWDSRKNPKRGRRGKFTSKKPTKRAVSPQDSYNSVDLDQYNDDNFEKFNKKK